MGTNIITIIAQLGSFNYQQSHVLQLHVLFLTKSNNHILFSCGIKGLRAKTFSGLDCGLLTCFNLQVATIYLN